MTSKEEKNEQYLSDVELFQKFIKDLSKLGKERIDSYQPNDFWDYAFLLSRSFLNDNFHKLFDLASEEQAKYLRIDKANLLSVYGEASLKNEDDNPKKYQVPYVSDLDIGTVVEFIKNTNNS